MQRKTIIRYGLNMFLFKSLNVFNLSAATKNLTTNYTFFVNSFICKANEWTGFFMIETSVIKELNQHVFY